MVNNQGIIIHKTGHKKGKRYDYNIYKNNHPVILMQVVSVFDLGYRGWERLSWPKVILAKQKDEKPRVDSRGKEYNQNHSKKKIVIEIPFQDEKAQDNGLHL